MSDNYANFDVYYKLTKFLLNSDCVCGSRDIQHVGAIFRICQSCNEAWGIDDYTGYEKLLDRLALVAVCDICRAGPQMYLIFTNTKDKLEIHCTTCGSPCWMNSEDSDTQYERSSSRRSDSWCGADGNSGWESPSRAVAKRSTSENHESSLVSSAVNAATEVLSATASRILQGGSLAVMRSLSATSSTDNSLVDALKKLTLQELTPAAPQIGRTLGTAAGMLFFKNPGTAAFCGAIAESMSSEAISLVKNMIEKKTESRPNSES